VLHFLNALSSRLLWLLWRRKLLRATHVAYAPVHVIFALLRAFSAKALRRVHGKSNHTICVSLVEHMGDIVAAEPLVRQLRVRYPDALLVWCVGSRYRELVDANPDVDVTLAVNCLTEWIILRGMGMFNKLVDLHLPNRVCAICALPLKKQEGDLTVTAENYYRFGNLLSVMARNAGVSVLNATPRVYIPDTLRLGVDRLGLPERFVAVHCTSNEPSRDWDALKWRRLVHRLVGEAGVDVVEIGLTSGVPGCELAHYLGLCGRLTILETAEVIRRAKLFIGLDSGPAHLANAVGTHGVILIGLYRGFENHMPYSGNYEKGVNFDLIRCSGPSREISEDLVYATVVRRLRA